MEEEDPRPGNAPARAPSEGAVDLDLLDQLLSGDDWLEVTNCSNNSPTGPSPSANSFGSFSFSPLLKSTTAGTSPLLSATANQDETQRSAISTAPVQSSELRSNSTGLGNETRNNWWIQPSNSNSSVRERFSQALAYINETQTDTDVLVQLWVPIRKEDQLLLTTSGQPFLLDQNCEKLIRYRQVSTRYQFSADLNSGNAPGLPGRVYIGRLPEWSPDVRYFTSYEYPRVNYAQDLDVHGTMALPVFEEGNHSCLGVAEVIMTRQKINFTSDLNRICSALQAVNLRSSEVSSVPRIKFNSASYQAALPEILEVLRAACNTHKLPLAQTWVSCNQQGKRGSRHSDENYTSCISTVDATCYVNDPLMQSFHEACSEHHLLWGQGVAGKAFMTNQPCFLADIGSATKLDYPLSHHAQMFNLKGAVAIRLRCTRTGTADFVLEFFLPTYCIELEEQKAVLDSLSDTMRNVCQTLRVVTDKEMEDETTLEMKELNSLNVQFDKSVPDGGQVQNKVSNLSFGANMTEASNEESSWTSLVGTSQKETSLLEQGMHGIGGIQTSQSQVLLPAGQLHIELTQPHHQGSSKDNEESMAGIQRSLEGRKAKRRSKIEKTVSLQVLRQYFAGSLKDAARSLGVCPTTLKRICRQHGITRWPSRKIKKVDHSLKKLQLIIDSVHGADAAFQLNTLYKDIANTSTSDNNLSGSSIVPPTNQNNRTDCENQQYIKLSNNMPSTSHAPSSCSHSSNSSPSCSGGATKHSPQMGTDPVKLGASAEENPSRTPQRENTPVNEHLSIQEAPRNLLWHESEKAVGGHRSSQSPSSPKQNADGCIRIKATFGTEKVRFRLEPDWNFQDLKQEIAKRLSIVDTSSLIIKYLDDDSEWVLMTCDADLDECLLVYKLSNAQTIKISVHPAASRTIRTSLDHIGLS